MLILVFCCPQRYSNDHCHTYSYYKSEFLISKLPLHITGTCDWHARPEIPLPALFNSALVNMLFNYEHINYPNRTISTAL
jgi:hypothetical protein